MSDDEAKTLRDRLREPLPAVAIKPHPTKKWSSSINGAYIVERLNDVFGEDGWFADYAVIENSANTKMIVVRCDLYAGKIRRVTYGGNDNVDRGDAYKGACTDALGKAASQLGIAGEVYKGLLDETQAPAAPDKPKKDRQRFEHVEGRVTNLQVVSPTQVWLQVNSNGIWIRTNTIADADQLRTANGCKVELTAQWAKGKTKSGDPQDLMVITAVKGVYDAQPRTAYVKREEDDPHLSPDMVGKI